MSILIVEDGTGVAYANSYVSYAEAVTYASARGKASLFDDEDTTEIFLVQGCDYLESLIYSGLPVFIDQSLLFPRSDIVLNRYRLPEEVIPENVKKAQIEVALAIASGVDVMPTTSGSFTKREKVGPIETEYSETVGFGTPEMPRVYALLASLFPSKSLRTYRV